MPERSRMARTAASNRPSGAITCARCDNWWTGLQSCHCGACHRTFTGVYAFDIHRAGSHAKGMRHCVDPATVDSSPLTSPGRHGHDPAPGEVPTDDDAGG